MLKSIYRFFHRHYHTRYHGIYAHARQLFVFDICLLLLSLGMLATALIFFFWKPNITEQIEFHISLGEARVLSGQVVPVQINYTNHSKFTLRGVSLAFKLPPGFILDTNTLPASFASNGHTIAVADLKPGADGELTFSGRLWSAAGSNDSLTAVFSYTPAGKSEPEQKISRFFIRLPGSVIGLTVNAPSSTFAGVPVPVDLNIANNSDEALLDLATNCNYPFITTSTVQNITLAPGATTVLHGTVTLQAAASGKLECTVTHRVNGTLLTVASRSTATQVVAPHIALGASIDGDTRYVLPASKLPVKITWRNDGQVQLLNSKIYIGFTPGTVDLATTARENNLRIEGDKLIVDGARRSALGSGAPGSGDSFTINVTLNANFSAPLDTAAWVVAPTFTANAAGVATSMYSQVGAIASLPIAAQMNIAAQVRYFTDEGDQLGRGPLPPAVGQTTKYWVLVTLNNRYSDLRNTSFTATLPAGVILTDNQSVSAGPALAWHPAPRTITWSAPRTLANTQTGIFFELAVTPTADMIGHSVPLTGPLNITATDIVSGKQISDSTGALTNVLNAKDRGVNKGAMVVE